MHLWRKCNCFCRFHKKIRFDAEYKDSRNGNKYELIYSLRRVLKTPERETSARVHRNTQDSIRLCYGFKSALSERKRVMHF